MNFELPSSDIANDQDNRDDNPTEEQCDRLFSTATAVVRGQPVEDLGIELADHEQDWASVELQQYCDAFEA